MEPKIVGKAQVTIVESEDFKNISLEELNKGIQVFKEAGGDVQYICDGFHNFKELYASRMAYNAALFNEWASTWYQIQQLQKDGNWVTFDKGADKPKYDVHKSWKHHDGEDCFGGGWFIVVAMLPTGQITNHYEACYWDLFRIPIAEKAKYPFDGHGVTEVFDRLKDLEYGG